MRRLPRTWSLLGSCLAALAISGSEQRAWARPARAKLLEYGDAQRYVLSLINRDRARAGLSTLVLDDAASRSGLRHARDMAANGFTGHVGSDGSVPEQRYSESAGAHFVQENAACLFDLERRKLDLNPRFDPAKLAALHELFMSERPPNDGHRRNILKASHNRVGIGLAQPADVAQPCLTQEFVDQYGEYSALPLTAKPKARLHVAGSIDRQLIFGGVGLGRTPLPKPPARESLNGNVYRIPAPDTLYFPPGFKTPKPVKLEGGQFSIDLDLGSSAQPGLYAVSIWAKTAPSAPLNMVSLRTIMVR